MSCSLRRQRFGLVLTPALASALLFAGCAAPNTPGAGHGAEYTPVIDLQGVDQGKYGADLAACRQLAKNVDAGRASMEGAIGGAILGAALSGMLGGGRQTTIDSANLGGFTGLNAAAADATRQSKAIIINCMVGRGYRALEVTPALGSYQQPMQTTAAAPSSAVAAPGAAAPMLPVPAGNPKRPTEGQYAFEAERIPAAKACAAMPQATLVNKGPGFELYSVACRNADTLMVRCEMGNCRPLK